MTDYSDFPPLISHIIICYFFVMYLLLRSLNKNSLLPRTAQKLTATLRQHYNLYTILYKYCNSSFTQHRIDLFTESVFSFFAVFYSGTYILI